MLYRWPVKWLRICLPLGYLINVIRFIIKQGTIEIDTNMLSDKRNDVKTTVINSIENNYSTVQLFRDKLSV